MCCCVGILLLKLVIKMYFIYILLLLFLLFTTLTDGRPQYFEHSFCEAIQAYTGTYGRRHLSDRFNAFLRQQS